MRVLGIETSCDETAAAIVENGQKILSNVVFSQEKFHRPFKGIVPEIASRAHVEKINLVVEKAMRDAGIEMRAKRATTKENQKRSPTRISYPPSHIEKIDAIAVTTGPGLIGSLLIGKMTADAVSWIFQKPLVSINHLEAHLYASLLEYPRLSPPFLGLIVSGGHTDLVIVRDFGHYKVLGRTRDDAVGESFDKVANILKLGYPGGPVVDRLAKKGNPIAISFPRPYLNGSWDFSFSGLKTAVLYYMQGRGGAAWGMGRGSNEKSSQRSTFNSQLVYDICASFQSAVVDVLVKKTVHAAKKFRFKKIVVGGGVAANSRLRERFVEEAQKEKLEIFLPSKEFCTDNAAMVAAAGYYKLRQLKSRPKTNMSVNPSLPILNW